MLGPGDQRHRTVRLEANVDIFRRVTAGALDVIGEAEASQFAARGAVGAARGLLGLASVGALAACVLVAVIGAAIHRPLARVPENALKFAVGVMLSAFGLFWTGESFGVDWPGGDAAILAFAALFLGVAAVLVVLLKPQLAEHA